MSDLEATAVITSALGTLIIDGINAHAYELHSDTLNEMSENWRKQETSNEWVEGSFVTSAVRENVTENLVVWVNGVTLSQVEERKAALLAHLRQLSYTVALTISGVTQTWTCQMADLSVRTETAHLHAPTALVTARVPRLPTKTVAGDGWSVTA